MKITTIYSKNCYWYYKNDKIIAIFTINCHNFHEKINLSHLLSKIVIFLNVVIIIYDLDWTIKII